MGGKLSVLAELSGLGPEEARVWSLRRADFDALAKLQRRLEDHRVLLVTGGDGLVGPVALALAAAGAAGRRTALIECDLARPRLAAATGLAPTPGLHEYLRWDATAAQILQPLALAGPAAGRASSPLICVPGGGPATDSATLLGSESYRHAVKKLRRAYDLVVLSGPALGPDRSSLEPLAAAADTLLACVSPAQVSGRGARAIRAAVKRLPVSPLGSIVVGES
jgi:Mrp family chromosome partitioning ATPase